MNEGSRTRTRRAPVRAGSRARAAAIALACLASLADASCAKRPDPPARANPLDPGNPETGGDPFHLTARVTGLAVELAWSAFSIPGSLGYSVYRARSIDSLASRPETLAAGLDTTGFRDARPLADGPSFYLVTVRNAGGEESLRSEALSVRLDLPPLIQIRAAGCDTCLTSTAETDSRDVRVTVAASGADSLYLSNARTEDDLVDPARLAYSAAPLDWRLSLSASRTDTTKIVFARVRRADGTQSSIVADSIAVAPLRIELYVDSLTAGPVLASRKVVAVEIRRSIVDPRPPAGAESLAFGLDPLGAIPLGPFTSSFRLSLEKPDLDTVYVRLKNDFGIDGTDSVAVKADSLLGATIVLSGSLIIPAMEPASTSLCRVNVHVKGGRATGICLSNERDSIPPCDAFEPIQRVRPDWPVRLPGPGEPLAGRGVRVFAVLANEWRPEGGAVVSDSIFLAGRSVYARIAYPERQRFADTSYVLGDSIAIEGTASRGTCGPDLLRLAVFADGMPIGDAILEGAAPGDSVDYYWTRGWRVSGTPDMATLTTLLTDAADSTARDTVFVQIRPRTVAP